MVTLNALKIETAKKFVGETADPPTYMAFGTGTTDPTRSDSTLTIEDSRKTIDAYGSENNVSYHTGNITNIDTSLHNALYENGLVDAITSGDFYTHHVHGAFTPGTDRSVECTQFIAVNPASNTNKAILTEHITTAVVEWLSGTSFPSVGSYVAWGSLLILDQCDSLGSGGNTWNDSTDATTGALDSTNYIEGTASIKMGKDGVASAVAYYDRTLASGIDITNATHLRIYLRVADSTTRETLASTGALIILFGSDNANYKSYTIDRANLIVGWQQIEITIADMITTGAPVTTATDYLKISWTTNNSTDIIASGDLLMDYWAFWWRLNYTDTILHQEIDREALGSSASRVNEVVTYESEVLKTDGNTYQYDYAGLFDAASGGNLLMVLEITPLQKNALVQITHQSVITVNIKDY